MKIRIILLISLALCNFASWASIRLPALVGDNMVIQRDIKVPIWGWASAGESISISFRDQEYTTVTAADGKWSLDLKAGPAGGPYQMVIKGNTDVITVNDISVGEVWVCSGQSNMSFDFNTLKSIYANEPDIKNQFDADLAKGVDLPIFQIIVGRTYAATAQTTFRSTGWKPADEENGRSFSVAAYFFAVELYKQLHVPIGLINASFPGTPVEAWMSAKSLQKFPQFSKIYQQIKDSSALAEHIKQYNQNIAAWDKKAGSGTIENDKEIAEWTTINFDDSAWETTPEPAYWDNHGHPKTYGSIWIRKEIDLPSSETSKDAVLKLGRIDDADITYFNGQKIGATMGRNVQRMYKINKELIKPGKNIILIRIINFDGTGGIFPTDTLEYRSKTVNVSLKGDWKLQLGTISDKPRPAPYKSYDLPGVLFNAIINPIIPYGIKGFIWYQGEGNDTRGYEYRDLFPEMITDWRAKWAQGDLPFIYQQLVNYLPVVKQPGESKWAEVRESQLLTLSKVPNTAMSVGIDIGLGNNLHPPDKKSVGYRLALGALYLAYHVPGIIFSGPAYRSARFADGKAYISFTNIGSGLAAKNGTPLKYFAIAGEDHHFYWADAIISGDKVVVSSSQVPNPVAVRYAWANNPEGCNLYNIDGLPASPFRTDDWPVLSTSTLYTNTDFQ